MIRSLLALAIVGALAVQAFAAEEVFPKAKINLQVGEKKKEVEASVKYTDSSFVVTDRKTGVAIKTFAYPTIKTMEYSQMRSATWWLPAYEAWERVSCHLMLMTRLLPHR